MNKLISKLLLVTLLAGTTTSLFAANTDANDTGNSNITLIKKETSNITTPKKTENALEKIMTDVSVPTPPPIIDIDDSLLDKIQEINVAETVPDDSVDTKHEILTKTEDIATPDNRISLNDLQLDSMYNYKIDDSVYIPIREICKRLNITDITWEAPELLTLKKDNHSIIMIKDTYRWYKNEIPSDELEHYPMILENHFCILKEDIPNVFSDFILNENTTLN